MKALNSIVFPREVLLIEIDRHCSFGDCNGRTLIGLTRNEAANYRGFECVRCQRWNDDVLSRQDIVDWWPGNQI
ncbi:MAG TPA: hypothetical protein VJ124_12825 [Pyrinomonadaceae bacterium]|nr:hypothetical protein [Pyrinomonadaceae bacterium]